MSVCLFIVISNRTVYAQELWAFNVVIAVERQTADYFQHTSSKDIATIARNQLATVTANFNSSRDFKGRFDFRADSVYVFDGDAGPEISRPHPGYTYKLVINGFSPVTSGGGWYGGNTTIYHNWPWHLYGGPFGKWATDGVTHEFGHARGAVDIYAMRVESRNNPINQQSFEAISSIMNSTYDNIVWDEHTVNLLNTTGGKPIVGEAYITKAFPAKIQLKAVNAQGKPMDNATIEIYPIDWYSNKVTPTPVLQRQTDGRGIFEFATNPFQPSTQGYPWHIRYANFLVKAVYNNVAAYTWMPLYNVQNVYFREGPASVYTAEIQFPDALPTFQLTSINDTVFCPGSQLKVSFTSSLDFQQDNTFTLAIYDQNNNSYVSSIIKGNNISAISGKIQQIEGGRSRVKVTSTNPKAQSDAYWIRIKPAPSPAVQHITLCQNATAPMLPVTGQNLLWYTSTADTTGSPVAPVPNTSQLGSTTYYVTQTLDGCESSRAPLQVTISPVPDAPGVTAKDICQFSPPEVLTATGTGLIWYNADGSRLNAAPIINTDKAATYMYQVTQTIAGCEGPKATLPVNVRGRAVATLTGSQTLTVGQSATVSVALGGEGPWTFSYRDSTAAGAGTVQTIQTAASSYTMAISLTKTTSYYLTNVSNVCGTGIITGGTVVVTVNPLLGLELLVDAIDVFPVPTTGTLTICINGLSPANPASLELTNLAGQALLRQETGAQTTTLPLDALPAGTYILQISVGNQKISKRIMKL
ncbi:hypothetical protein GCM10023189_30290 [Nibrella saemangeumensis]|uniref:Por secretion system C-terminal sorting domain-containing protein n=1 Tax=Nibrella saemangeumensis TaxID=1084526 RepID=A0ABP8N261_9BACT